MQEKQRSHCSTAASLKTLWRKRIPSEGMKSNIKGRQKVERAGQGVGGMEGMFVLQNRSCRVFSLFAKRLNDCKNVSVFFVCEKISECETEGVLRKKWV